MSIQNFREENNEDYTNNNKIKPGHTSYTTAIIKNVWSIGEFQRSLLEIKDTYYSDIQTFLNKINHEQYPSSYEDTMLQPTTNKQFDISYIYTSGLFLEELLYNNINELILLQFRSSKELMVRCCLVRRFAASWTLESAIARGAREFPDYAYAKENEETEAKEEEILLARKIDLNV